MGTIRQILNQSLMISVGIAMYVAQDIGFFSVPPIVRQLGAWLIIMGAGVAIYNRFTRPDN